VNKKAKIVIGVSGKNGSGKDTVGDYIEKNFDAKKLVFSKFLEKALMIFLDEIKRDDYSWLATNLRKKYGKGVLGKAMQKKIDRSYKDVVVISGVRDLGELEMIKSYEYGFLIYVKAKTKVRWQRIMERKIKIDDNVSFEEFKNGKDKLASEKDIEKIGKKSDFTIENDGTHEELLDKIEEVMEKILKKAK
jgi:dephospho-CoA kinase